MIDFQILHDIDGIPNSKTEVKQKHRLFLKENNTNILRTTFRAWLFGEL